MAGDQIDDATVTDSLSATAGIEHDVGEQGSVGDEGLGWSPDVNGMGIEVESGGGHGEIP